jgi:hypothetical protein
VWQSVRRSATALVFAASALCALSSPGRADAIDGQWCLGASHFSIDGPNILTPGGNRLQGNYSRHGFFYIVPANEPGAGGEINMLLLNEETVQLTRTDVSSAPEIWQRCKPTS